MNHAKMFIYSSIMMGWVFLFTPNACLAPGYAIGNFISRDYKGQDPHYATKDCPRYAGPFTEKRIIGDETTLYPPSQSHYFLYHRIRVAPDMWLDTECVFGAPAVAYRRCNIRTKPSTEGKIVGKTKRHDTYYVSMGREGNWLIVYHKGSARYVWDDCLEI